MTQRGFSLVEVMVAAVVLGVVALSYTGMFKTAISQKDAFEQQTAAMELATRQIEYLRTLDFTTTLAKGAPFTSVFNNNGSGVPPCPDGNNIPYDAAFGGVSPGQLEAGLAATTLSPVNRTLLGSTRVTAPPTLLSPQTDAGGRNVILAGKDTVGPPQAGRPNALAMPPEYSAKGYSVVVRATRIRDTIVAVSSPPYSDPANPVQVDKLLIKFQINVFRGGTPVLVVPFIKEAEL